MNRQIMTIWIAGFMIGSGSGLIIARSLPGPIHADQTAAGKFHREPARENRTPNSLYPDFLADPQQFPLLQPPKTEQMGETFPAKSSEADQVMPEPRLLPEGEAMPVQPEQSQNVMKKPTASEFQSDLKKIAPELSEKALDDLAKIRSQIENEQEASNGNRSGSD